MKDFKQGKINQIEVTFTTSNNELTLSGAFEMNNFTTGNSLLKNCISATKITITGVTKLGAYAFEGFNKLESITIPSSVTTIGSNVFEGCEAPTTITYEGTTNSGDVVLSSTIPTNLKVIATLEYTVSVFGKTSVVKQGKIDQIDVTFATSNNELTLNGAFEMSNFEQGASIFKKFKSATTITLTGVTKIGSYAFEGFTSLTSITIPASVINIGSGAFMSCSGITKIVFEEEIQRKTLEEKETTGTTISQGAFSGCTSLSEITIPPTVTEIQSNAFNNCASLKEIKLPVETKTIQANAFNNCESLKSVSIAPGANIQAGSFSNCNNIETVNLLGSEEIPADAPSTSEIFPQSTKSIKKVEIAETITGFAKPPLSNLGELESIHYYGGNDFSKVDLGVEKGSNIKAYVDESKFPPEASFGKDVKIVEQKQYGNLFWNFDELTNKLEITGSGIMNDAETNSPFTSEGVTQVIIEEGITSIGNNCFKAFKQPETIDLPSTIESIGENSFKECSAIKTIVIPSSVKSIGKNAFEGCTLLGEITLPTSTLFTIISSSLFKGCIKLASITIPASVTTIGANSFEGCSSIKTIVIPSSVNSVGKNAFEGCSLLGEITYEGTQNPSEVTLGTIKSGAVVNVLLTYESDTFCTLTNVVKKGTDGKIAITYTVSKTSLTISGTGSMTDKTTGASLLKNCASATTVTITDVTHIGAFAFEGFNKLATITIPSSVTTIGDKAFDGCNSLTTIYFYGKKEPTLASAQIKTQGVIVYVTSDYIGTTFAGIGITQLERTELKPNHISDIKPQIYTKEGVTLDENTLIVKVGDKQLTINNDYTVTYENNKNIGEDTVTVTTQTYSPYQGSASKTFEITKATQSPEISFQDNKVIVDNLEETTKYTVKYYKSESEESLLSDPPTKTGDYFVKVIVPKTDHYEQYTSGFNNYHYQNTFTKDNVQNLQNTLVYQGNAESNVFNIVIKVGETTLAEDQYSVSYTDNEKVKQGRLAKVTITGRGDYSTSKVLHGFTITQAEQKPQPHVSEKGEVSIKNVMEDKEATVTIEYFSDKEANKVIEQPTAPGTYYYKFTIKETNNYAQYVSEITKYTIEEESNSEEGLTSGEVAGITIGVIIVVAAIAFCVYWFVLRKPTSKSEHSKNTSTDVVEMVEF